MSYRYCFCPAGFPFRLERETGIEPASLAWKARVLPLNYSRIGCTSQPLRRLSTALHKPASQRLQALGGGGWIRTIVGVSQQIYSLPPLATRAPLRRTSKYTTFFGRSDQPRQVVKPYGGPVQPQFRTKLTAGRKSARMSHGRIHADWPACSGAPARTPPGNRARPATAVPA